MVKHDKKTNHWFSMEHTKNDRLSIRNPITNRGRTQVVYCDVCVFSTRRIRHDCMSDTSEVVSHRLLLALKMLERSYICFLSSCINISTIHLFVSVFILLFSCIIISSNPFKSYLLVSFYTYF